jgi:hypothetical protein
MSETGADEWVGRLHRLMPMQHTRLFVPATLFAAGLFSANAGAHEPMLAVGLPPMIVDTGLMTVAVGVVPPPPPVVVQQPRPVVVERVVDRRPTVVVVRERDPVVVVQDRCDHPGRGHHYGKHKHGHRSRNHRGRAH